MLEFRRIAVYQTPELLFWWEAEKKKSKRKDAETRIIQYYVAKDCHAGKWCVTPWTFSPYYTFDVDPNGTQKKNIIRDHGHFTQEDIDMMI